MIVNCTVSAENVNFCSHVEKPRFQHEAPAQACRQAIVKVFYVEPGEASLPNRIFVSDLMFMTPEGAVPARPASTARPGEEHWVARRLAELGVPILKSIRGRRTFGGADDVWIDPSTVMLGRRFRTNADGASQVTALRLEMNVREKSPYRGFPPNKIEVLPL